MTRKNVNVLLVFMGVFVGLVAFQNCGSKNFSMKTSTIQSVDDVVDETDTDTDTDTDIDDDIYTEPGTDVSFSGCKSFQELSGNVLTVPARTSAGVCFYLRLMTARGADASGSRGEVIAPDVIARAHTRTDEATKNHPYVLGEYTIDSLKLLGMRNVALSSSFTDPQASMYIDNFFLLEQHTSVGTDRLWAYGTVDAEPDDGNKKIMVNNVSVQDFYPFAVDGTATVTAIDLTGAIPANLGMKLRFRGLDCGGSATASDVFLVFH